MFKLNPLIDIERLTWKFLSQNSSPGAIKLLENNLDKIDWYYLSQNPNAIHILENNIDKLNWYRLSANPNIFVLDYEFLKERMDIIREELMMKAWHPTRVNKWLEAGMDMETF